MNAYPRAEPPDEDLNEIPYIIVGELNLALRLGQYGRRTAGKRMPKTLEEDVEKRRLPAGELLHFSPSAWLQNGILGLVCQSRAVT